MKNFIILVISVCLVLLALEFVFRFRHKAWSFASPLYVDDHLTERDLKLRWRYSPSEKRNSLGLRNREIGLKKAGIFRILVLGDSLNWAAETSSGELYSEVLEHYLNTLYPNGFNSYEVINAGIPGYTTYQELEFLKIYGLDMDPDLVVLGFVFNDLYYKYLHRPTKDSLLNIEPATYLHQFNTNSFPGIILARSYLAHGVIKKIKMLWKRILQQPVFPFDRRRDFYLAWKNYGWVNAQNLIGEMEELLAEKEISLVVLVFPVSNQVDDRYRSLNKEYVLYPQSMISKICDNYGIRFLGLTDTIYMKGGITLFRDYLHLNAKGNDVILEKLKEYFMTEIDIYSHKRRILFPKNR